MSKFDRKLRGIQRSLYRLRKNALAPFRGLARTLSPKRVGRRATKATSKVLSGIQKPTESRGRRKWLHLILASPAIVFLLVTLLFTLRSIGDQHSKGPQYLVQGSQAFDNGDFNATQIFITRALEAGGIDSQQANLLLAQTWLNLGYTGRGMHALQDLAPSPEEKRRGYPRAHRYMAILISRQAGPTPSDDVLTRWHWHLINAEDDGSADLNKCWGDYYLNVNDLRAALKAYQNATARYPQVYMTIANLYDRLGQFEQKQQVLTKARAQFRDLVTENPTDRNSRVAYATTLLQLGELVEAEQVLRTGMKLDPEGPYKVLLAATFVQLYDQFIKGDENLQAKALQQIRNALEFEPNFAPALRRLLGFAKVDESSIPELREMLEDILASGEGTAVAHLALSNLAWLENNVDAAALHLEQAMELDAKMPVIANNLAWLLAHDDPPNLDRAHRIADMVVTDHPDNPRFLDTRGTILQLMGRSKEALTDLEKALPGMRDKGPVHLKIASVYRDLGMEEIAKKHEAIADADAPPR